MKICTDLVYITLNTGLMGSGSRGSIRQMVAMIYCSGRFCEVCGLLLLRRCGRVVIPADPLRSGGACYTWCGTAASGAPKTDE